ncbi:MAG: DUF5916 domain-containing protein [Gammaproteobacteria bacterium]
MGLTAKLTLTSGVTLSAAINPDFAQVESDQLIVTANQRFPIFFEEKRPFFLEGTENFQTPIRSSTAGPSYTSMFDIFASGSRAVRQHQDPTSRTSG